MQAVTIPKIISYTLTFWVPFWVPMQLVIYQADEILKIANYVHAATCNTRNSLDFYIVIEYFSKIISHTMCVVIYYVYQLLILHKIVCIIVKSMMTVLPFTLIEQPLNMQNCFFMAMIYFNCNRLLRFSVN